MWRNIGLKVNQLPVIPATLRSDPRQNNPCALTAVDLGRLYHHYYLDSYDTNPPDPDPTNFEYLAFLANTAEFRFLGEGPGAHPGKRRSISYELGQAFCRWVLHDHFGIRYFAHMARVLDRPTHPAFEGMRIERISAGDTPDYLCARSVSRPMLAEAKGSFDSVDFATADFRNWRAQFSRVRAVDRHRGTMKLKGYIAATRFVTEANTRLPTSTMYLEDPESPGDEFTEQFGRPLGRIAVALHYALVLQKLGLSVMSASLEHGFVAPSDLQFLVATWKCVWPTLKDTTFVGGYWARSGGRANIGTDGMIPTDLQDLFVLGRRHFPFFGLDLKVVRKLREATLGGWSSLDNLDTLEIGVPRPSQVTWLEDGTITGPLEFFRFIEPVSL